MGYTTESLTGLLHSLNNNVDKKKSFKTFLKLCCFAQQIKALGYILEKYLIEDVFIGFECRPFQNTIHKLFCPTPSLTLYLALFVFAVSVAPQKSGDVLQSSTYSHLCVKILHRSPRKSFFFTLRTKIDQV